MQSGNIETFSHLSQFKDIKDFNNNIEQWMTEVKTVFTKSELVALKRLIRYSAKIAGVCTAKIATLVSATYTNNGNGISRSTFKRMAAKAQRLGLLIVTETVRKNGSQSANVYAFQRFELPKSEKLNHHKTVNPIKTNNNKNKLKRTTVSQGQLQAKDMKLDAAFVSESLPLKFVEFVKYFIDDAKHIEEYWHLVKCAAMKFKITENISETAIQSFKVLIRKVKLCRVKNPYGFFYGVLNKKFKALFLQQAFNHCWS
ncbi:hypothetical protein [Cytobacillus oceanisediminis]|uniref:hypothetical protein n=1 Tax=Cytobacillus oceanisediminis TaxID=665099 RepID=UPI00207A7A4B|nr:hypothetical protein [Cytobacillus oceanisediminis]USK45510.1 hypothetical protein LIT27_06585 [Cytobacillus oceanisediminis]